MKYMIDGADISAIKKIINGNDFPVQPLKLLYKGDLIRPVTEGDSQLQYAVGFISKLPPGGCAFVDLVLEKKTSMKKGG